MNFFCSSERFSGIEKMLKAVTKNPMKNTNFSFRIDLKDEPPRKKSKKLKKRHVKTGIIKLSE